tara:strand:- start:2812 stop:3105 length:294 start_codon:yes stop_codon:yes gene_type:complete
MRNIFFIIIVSSILFSCNAVERKIDKLSTEEEKKLTRFLGKQQIILIDEFGKPDDVIYENDNKILVFTTTKYNISCVRKFTLNKKNIITGFSSRNCF